MAKLHTRWIVAALFLSALLVGVPSWGQASRRGPGTTPRPAVNLPEEMTRIFRLLLGNIWEKTGNTLDPNGSPGGPPPTAPPGEIPDTGNTLDPNG